jgi:AraC family transcriptional activator of pobA
MDNPGNVWYFSAMLPDVSPPAPRAESIPVWTLYGENQTFPDLLHIERITDRAAGLDWRIAPHRHLHLHQFFLILDGDTRVTLDGLAPQATPPFVLSVPPGTVHGFHFSAGTAGYVLTVPLQSLPELLATAGPQGNPLGQAGLLPPDPDLLSLFAAIYAEHAAAHPARALMLRGLATQVACLVLRGMDRARAAIGPIADPRYQKFQTLILQHLRDGWRLTDYARAIGVSDRHLNRISRLATGLSAAAVVEAALMREACRLLVYTRASIASVGYDLGFEDPSYFSRAFRRGIGLSPGAYRAGFERE